MLNMSAFGMFHTALALVAVVAGIIALARSGEIGSRTRAGRIYIWFTVATCITGLFIFHHGGFGVPHVLAIVTLLVLALAWFGERRPAHAGIWRYVAVLGYSLTLFFHLIPGLTETGTRIPLAAPAFSGPQDPLLKTLVAAGFVVYLFGATLQAIRIRQSRRLPLAA